MADLQQYFDNEYHMNPKYTILDLAQITSKRRWTSLPTYKVYQHWTEKNVDERTDRQTYILASFI